MPAPEAKLNLLITGGAGFIGSNLVLELQERFSNSRLTVIDDFRSGDFKNLAGYRGDFVAANLAELNWREQFGEEKFDAIFHLASITDTTNHDQFEQEPSHRRHLCMRGVEGAAPIVNARLRPSITEW